MLTTKRSYEETHPWLSFVLNLRRVSYQDWLALGEAVAMSRSISHVPLDPVTATEFHRLYLAKGVQATTAIEGNTLSVRQVRDHIDGTLTLPPSRQYLEQEISNIVDAYNVLTRELAEYGKISLTVEKIGWMNGMVLRELKVRDHVEPGRIRKTNVGVGSYRCPDWRDAEHLLERLCEMLNKFDSIKDFPDRNRHVLPIIKAILAHLYLAWIHPYGDGNGRTARLVEFAILIEAGLPQPVCHLLSNHYNSTRTDYYWQLDQASRVEKDIYGFVSYAISGLVDGLVELTEAIHQRQLETAWINFVHEEFRNVKGTTARRRRSLALALAGVGEEVEIVALPNLSPDLTLEYAKVSRKTLTRDVFHLQRHHLLVRDGTAVRANREHMLALLPWRNTTAAQ